MMKDGLLIFAGLAVLFLVIRGGRRGVRTIDLNAPKLNGGGAPILPTYAPSPVVPIYVKKTSGGGAGWSPDGDTSILYDNDGNPIAFTNGMGTTPSGGK
jgi:hypothetical protein